MSVSNYINILLLPLILLVAPQQNEITYVLFDTNDEFCVKEKKNRHTTFMFYDPEKKAEKEKFLKENDPRAAAVCDRLLFQVVDRRQKPIGLDSLEYLTRTDLIELSAKYGGKKIDLDRIQIIERSPHGGYMVTRVFFDPCL